MIELLVQQGSPEWHAARAQCYTASEAPAMMGASRYMKRSELVRQKATGIIPEVDAATQRLFDRGHETEAMARPLAEEIIGKSLAPCVATDDSGKYLASSDGVTVSDDFVTLDCEAGFEHKLWNADIAAQVAAGEVPESHKWQLDHQFLVFNFKRILFVCSDGTRENFASCWYYPDEERIKRLVAGWEQFALDVANYQHVEAVAAPVAEVIEDLPALTVQLVGQVTSSNLATFQSAVLERIKAINTTLVTDADFANADKMVKFLDDGEKRLDLVKSQALAQTESIDQLFRTIDSLKAEMRSKRLTLDKLVKAEKETRKAEIATNARADLMAHADSLHKRIGFPFLQVGGAIFSEAIKGLKSLDSMRDKVSVALAHAKIEANEIADLIEFNQKQMQSQSAAVLFPDFAQVCTKAPDDFAALLTMRVSQRREAEEKRLAAERERIRVEEQAKAQREAADKLADEQAKAAAAAPAPAQEQPKPAPQPVAHIGDSGNMLKLGDICARLGVTMTADFLASMGYRPVAIDKNAKLYHAYDFPAMCEAIAAHCLKVARLAQKAA